MKSQQLVECIIETGAYLRREYRGKIYENSSLEEFITSKLLKGCGWPLAKVERLLRDDPEARALWRNTLAGLGGQPGDSHIDNIGIPNDAQAAVDALVERFGLDADAAVNCLVRRYGRKAVQSALSK